MKDIHSVLVEQNTVLDEIILGQEKIHQSVKTKDWVELENNMALVQEKTLCFTELDSVRENLSKNIKLDNECSKLMSDLHAKLLKSKINNEALTKYISITQNFVQGVLDNVVPQRRNVLYSKNGKIIKPRPDSIVLNKVL